MVWWEFPGILIEPGRSVKKLLNLSRFKNVTLKSLSQLVGGFLVLTDPGGGVTKLLSLSRPKNTTLRMLSYLFGAFQR